MPFVNVQHMAGAFTAADRASLIRDITEAYVKVGGEGIRPFVTVVINEVADGSWGSGGEAKTLATVEAARIARNASS
jgi:phenylpyruvate tautomerase PptA (4-oxalocrotonate tautomerase family)